MILQIGIKGFQIHFVKIDFPPLKVIHTKELETRTPLMDDNFTQRMHLIFLFSKLQ